MNIMALDLSNLIKAVSSLERALNFITLKKADSEIDPVEMEVFKAGVVQNFEFTYDLCLKSMKQWLELNLTPGMLSGTSRNELFRHALEQNLISDFYNWVKYNEMRNIAAHSYNVELADEIFEMAFDFQKDALNLIKQIEAHKD